MIAHALQLAALVACFCIFFRVEPVLNLMGPACRFSVRVAFWLLAAGPVVLIASILQGYRPNLGTVLALGGVAAFLFVERRVRGLLGVHTRRLFRERRERT